MFPGVIERQGSGKSTDGGATLLGSCVLPLPLPSFVTSLCFSFLVCVVRIK